MKVVVKKSALDQIIKQLAEDRSYHSARIDQIAGEGQPVLPDAQMATQLSASRVPVEDPDFLPVNTQQLSAAAAEIAEKVPQDKVQKFYVALLRLLRSTTPPAQYKGMSETDLMEALRPFITREAKLLSFIGQDAGDDEDDDGASVDTGFRAGPTSDRPEGPPKRKTRKSAEDKKATKIAKRAAKAKAAAAPIVSIGGVKLKSHEIDELELMRQRWTMAPDLVKMQQIKDQTKLDLADVVSGDANRLLDIFEKAEISLPSTLKEAQIDIQVEESMARLENFDEQTPIRRIRFFDLATPPREEIAKEIKLPIVHTGGPIEVTSEYADGRKEDHVYYLVKNFPFNQQEYLEAFGEALARARRERHEEALAILSGKREKEEQRLAAAEEPVDKKKRAATMQKSLSIGLAGRDAVAMREENPKKLEKILGSLSPSMSLADFDALTDEERDSVLKNVIAVLDKERGPYYDVGEMDYLRDIFSDESEDEYMGSEEGVESTSPIAQGVERLAEEFFESALKPVMRDVIDAMLEENPKITAGIDDIAEGYSFDSYENFISEVDDKDGFIDLLTSVTKDILTKNPDIFDDMMPDFAAIRKAVETKDEKKLAPYIARFKLLGVGEAGRLRSIFQYLKSPVAFMKAIDTTVRIKDLSGKAGFAEEIADPETRMNIIVKKINNDIESDPTAFFLANKRALVAAGVNSPMAVSSDKSKAIKAVAPVMSDTLSRSIKNLAKKGTQGNLGEKVESAINSFVDAISSDFIDLSDVTDPASKPVLNYVKKFVDDVKNTAQDPVFDKLSSAISQAAERMIKGQSKPASKKK